MALISNSDRISNERTTNRDGRVQIRKCRRDENYARKMVCRVSPSSYIYGENVDRVLFITTTHISRPTSPDCFRRRPLDCSRRTCKCPLGSGTLFAALNFGYWLSCRRPDCCSAAFPARTSNTHTTFDYILLLLLLLLRRLTACFIENPIALSQYYTTIRRYVFFG